MAANPFPFGNPADLLGDSDDSYTPDLNFGKKRSYETQSDRFEPDYAARRARVQASRPEVNPALFPGDPDETLRKYFPGQQISSAGAEQARLDAKEKARTVLDSFPDLPEQDRVVLEEIAEYGWWDKTKRSGISTFLKVLDFVDTPGELIRTLVADVRQIDQKRGGEEITFADYGDILFSRQEQMAARHSDEFVRQMQTLSDFGIEGKILAEADAGIFDVDYEEGTDLLKVARGTHGFVYDVLLDPSSWISFGTLGAGRKAAIEALTATAVGSAKSKSGWLHAVEHLAQGGKAADLTGVAGRAARKMEERIAKEGVERTAQLAESIAREGIVDLGSASGILTGKTRQIMLAEERRAAELLGGLPLTKARGLVEKLGKLGDQPVWGTAFEHEVSQIAQLGATRQWKSLYQDFGEYVSEAITDGGIKGLGGVTLAAPMFRKRLPMITLGVRTNAPGREVIVQAMKKLPPESQQWLRNLGGKLSSSRRAFQSADQYGKVQGQIISPYFRQQTVLNHARLSDAGIKLQGTLGSLKGSVSNLNSLAKKAGLKQSAVERIAIRVINGDIDALRELPPEIADDVLAQADGVAGVLQTIHAAAVETGMSIGKIEDFVPLVADTRYTKMLDQLAENGRAIRLDKVADAEERLGREIIAQTVAASSGRGRAVKRFGESVHQNSRIATATVESSTGGLDNVMHLDQSLLDPALGSFRLKHWDHETLNRAVSKALDSLAAENMIDPKKVRALQGQPFSTDLATVLDSYVASMTTAMQQLDAEKLFRQAGLVADEATRVSVTRTLKHVNDTVNSVKHPVMRFLDDLALSVKEGAAESVSARASVMQEVKVAGGWSLNVPAAIVGTRPFDRIVSKLNRVYGQVQRNIREAQHAVHQHVDKLVSEGVPHEVAVRASLSKSSSELAEVVADLRRLGDEQAAELRVLAFDQASQNVHKVAPEVLKEQMARAAKEAATIRAGVADTIRQMEADWAKRMGVTVEVADFRTFDLGAAAAPEGSGSFFDWLARKGDQFLAENGVNGWRPLEDLSPDELASATAHPELARRGVDHIVEGAEMVDLTVADVVAFGDPSSAARAMEVLARQLNEAGLAADDIMSPTLREAVQAVEAAEDLLDAARRGLDYGEELTVKAAHRNLIEARAHLVTQAEELLGNQTLIHEKLLLARDSVDSILDNDLFSPVFADVWAAALAKLPKIKKGSYGASFADEMRAAGIKSVSQGALFQNGSKAAMRDAAIRSMSFWHGAVDAAMEMAGSVSLYSFEPSTLELAMRALRSGDSKALANFEGELNALLNYAWPSMEGTLKVRPSGAVVFEHAGAIPEFVAFEDVVGELRKIVPGGDNMNMVDLMQIAVESWRAAPDAMEGASDKLSAWFRQLDTEGGFDFDVEAYEALRSFSDELRKIEVAKPPRGRKPTQAQVNREAAETALNEVLDAVHVAAAGPVPRAPVSSAPSMPVEVLQEWKAHPERFVFSGSSALTDETLDLFDTGQDAFNRGGAARSWERAAEYSLETRPSGAAGALLEGASPTVVMLRVDDLPPDAQSLIRRGMDVEEIFPRGNPFDYPPVRPVGWFRTADGFPEIVEPAAVRGRGVGEKGLLRIWENNVAALRKGMPNDIVDRARALVEHTVALRQTKVPKSVLDRQMKLRGHLWEPLDEAFARASDDILDLVAEARATGSQELEAAADAMRTFQDMLERLNRLGDDYTYGPRSGYADLVSEGAIRPQLEDVQRAALNAFEAVEKAALKDPDFLLGLSLPLKDGKPATIRRWVEAQSKRVKSWKPIEVAVPNKDQFVRLDTVGVGGVFEGQIGERTTALLLENMAGHLAAINTSAGMRAMAENVRGFEKWWRAAVTVGRPTFVPRNIIGGVFNGTIIGVGPSHYAYTAQNIMPALRRIRNGSSTWAAEIAQGKRGAGAYLEGLERSGVLGTSFSGTSLQHLKAPTRFRTKINPASSQNAVFQAGGRFMETSEDFLRASAFIANYNPAKPASALTAKALTLVAHFDYNDLTSYERGIKKLAPFFTWTRNNVPLQLRTMFERPGIYTKYRHFTTNLEESFGVEEDQAGNKYRSGIAASIGELFSLGEGSEFWANAVFDPDLPFRDVEELLNSVDDDGPFGLVGWAIQSLSPVLTAPVDLTGSQDYQVVAPTGLASILKFVDAVTPGELVTPALDGSVLVSPRTRDIGNLLLPFLNEYTELAGVVPSSGAARSQLGYDVTDGVQTGESVRASALRLARSLGLGLDTPEDKYNAANDAIYRTIDEIIDRAYTEGNAVDPDDLERLMTAIIEQEGILVP